ncbi:MAG: peptidylprolyl isomerase [Planctomycetota bacterium]|nr:hypothetical protein [Planctomycetota bacterium]MDP6838183.1 peptidylprolyl isomerase [Planctomycetota bacterium]
MPTHKVATDISIAPVEEKSGFAQFVDSWWKVAAGLAVIATIAILASQHSRQADTEASGASWDILLAAAPGNNMAQLPQGDAPDIQAALPDLVGTPAEPWAMYTLASAQAREENFSAAISTLEGLRDQYPDHTLNTVFYPYTADGPPHTPVDNLIKALQSDQTWQEAMPQLFQNPVLPAESPRVRLTTDAGDVVLGLYQRRSPKHVENFLKHCADGFYDNTLFHRVVADFMIQGGDPNSREGEPDTWGLGGPDYKIDAEENDLFHFKGVLSAAKQSGESQSSGSQFFITTGAPHHLDGVHVVFGAVVEGMDVVDTIGSGAIEESTADRPAEPVRILSTTVLE